MSSFRAEVKSDPEMLTRSSTRRRSLQLDAVSNIRYNVPQNTSQGQALGEEELFSRVGRGRSPLRERRGTCFSSTCLYHPNITTAACRMSNLCRNESITGSGYSQKKAGRHEQYYDLENLGLTAKE